MRRKGDLLITILIMAVCIAVLCAVIIPRLLGGEKGKRETSLRYELETLRSAIDKFHKDTGCYPKRLGDLVCPANNPPASGVGRNGEEIPISPAKYHGPYLLDGKLPINPSTGGNVEGKDWHYEIEIRISSSHGHALDGTNYADW